MNKRQPHRLNNRFYNYPGEPFDPAVAKAMADRQAPGTEQSRSIRVSGSSIFWRSVYMYATSYAQRVAAARLIKNHTVPYTFQDVDHITWIGHASFLISINGLTILTDPVFGDLTFLLQRFSKPGIAFEELPKIDMVLLSHNHRDHMDSVTLKALYAKTNCHFYVPFGDKAWFDSRGMGDRVTECMWWQDIDHKGLKLTFLPARHWSQRGLFDRNTSLWGSWMIQDRIYFGGDTAYSDHFKEIAYHFPDIEVALLPIGPCEPRKWMKTTHMDAVDAGKAFLDLGARIFIPMHWGTYGFGIDDLMLPVTRLNDWWKQQNIKNNEQILSILACGQSYFLTRISRVAPFVSQKFL